MEKLDVQQAIYGNGNYGLDPLQKSTMTAGPVHQLQPAPSEDARKIQSTGFQGVAINAQN